MRNRGRLLQANAGSGKTYRVSLEFIRLILELGKETGYSNPDVFRNVLIITFTRKATAEIRKRIGDQMHLLAYGTNDSRLTLCASLSEIRGGTELNPTETDYLTIVLSRMRMNRHRMRVHTIDGLFGQIFRTQVAPLLNLENVRIEDTSSGKKHARVLLSLLGDETATGALSEVVSPLVHRSVDPAIYTVLIAKILQLRNTIEFPGRMFHALSGDTDPHRSFGIYREQLYRILLRLESIDPEITNLLVKKPFKERLMGANPGTGIDPGQVDRLFSDQHLRLFGKKYPPEEIFMKSRLKGVYEDLLSQYRVAWTWLLVGQFQSMLREDRNLRSLAGHIYRHYDHLGFTEKVLSFADIERLTRLALLGEDLSDSDGIMPSYYESLAREFRYILIDEFQDTSVSQWSLFRPLLAELLSGEGIHEGGGFILVGDVKQAIYGWRGGEKDLLPAVPDIFGTYGDRVFFESPLVTSYRSKPVLVAFVNDFFGDRIGASAIFERSGLDWGYLPMKAKPGAEGGQVDIFFDHYCIGEPKSGTYRNFVDNVLLPNLGNPETGHTKGKAILARTGTDLEKIASLLNRRGVPFVYEASGSILNHRVLVPMMQLFRFVVWRNRFDLACFLRSDPICIGPEDLCLFLRHFRNETRNSGTRTPEDGEVDKTTQPFTALSFACRVLEMACADCSYHARPIFERLKAYLSGLNPFESASRQVCRYIEYFRPSDFHNTDNDQRNLNRFHRVSRSFDNDRDTRPGSLSAFMEWLNDHRDSAELKQVGLEDPGLLRLMTIHRSKGLEFDHVFVYYNFSARTPAQSFPAVETVSAYNDDFSGFSDLLIGFPSLDAIATTDIETLDPDVPGVEDLRRYVELSGKKKANGLVEELNGLYVALTRARERLSLFAVVNRKEHLEPPAKPAANPVAALYDLLLSLCRERGFHKDTGVVFGSEDTGETSPIPLPADDLDSAAIAGFIDRYTEETEKPAVPLDDAMCAEALCRKEARVTGEIAHDWLSRIVSADDLTPERLAEHDSAVRAHWSGFLQPEKLNLVLRRCEEAVRQTPELLSPRWNRVRTEWSMPDAEGRDIRIDRLMIDDNENVIRIVDYKTGETADPLQLERYRAAIEKLAWVRDRHYRVETEFISIL